MSPPIRRRGRPARPCGTAATSISRLQAPEHQQRTELVEIPVGPEWEAVVAAQLHLEHELGFPAGRPSPAQVRVLRATRRYRDLVAHMPDPEEGP